MRSLVDDGALIPKVLKAQPNWLVWRLEERETKLTKRPYQAKYPTQLARVNWPSDWATFDEALDAYHKDETFSGIGWVPTAALGIIGGDLDHCIDDDGVFSDLAQEFMQALDGTFFELSPSGRGLRFFVAGSIPYPAKRGPVELWSLKHFLTLTGRRISTSSKIARLDEPVMALWTKYLKHEPQEWVRPPSPPGSSGTGGGLRDDDLIDKARRSSNKFAQLFDGDASAYIGHSEADLALCSLLAWWSGHDPAQIDRIFRRSKLYREKWERPSYRRLTIGRAIAGCRGRYEART